MRIGIIGMGFMGGVHLNAWQQNAYAEVVAVCDANPVIGKAKGNIEVGSDELNLDGVRIHTDVAQMLEAESLDAVSITLPTHLHKTVSIQCLEAGVHVLCEKPMALSVADCDDMIAAAESAGKELMIAHCIRFWPAYAWLKDALVSGDFGKVRSAAFERLTYAPDWNRDNWFSDQTKSGGIALDLHIHDLDFIQYLFGLPEKVESRTSPLKPGVVGHILSDLVYGSDIVITAEASWMMPESYGFSMAYKVEFEQAAVVFDGSILKLFPVDAQHYAVDLPKEDGYTLEINYFADWIRGAVAETIITPEQARESVRMALETIEK